MQRSVLVACGNFAVISIAGTGLYADLALAQQAVEAMDEIVVEGAVERPRVSRGGMQVPVEQIELKRQVNFADLDLGDDADVTELRSRIEIIAKESCQQLSRMFPRPSDTAEIASCINRAVNSAEEQVRAAVAAAK